MLERFKADFPALAGRIGRDYLPSLLANATYETVPAGTPLIRDQQLVRHLWLIADGICEVDLKACYGCGLCIGACDTNALSLVKKGAEELKSPPEDEKAWRQVRALTRKP